MCCCWPTACSRASIAHRARLPRKAVRHAQPLWEEDLLEEVSSSPSQVGNLVYLFSEEGKAWIIEPQADACKRVGEFEMGEPVRSSPAFQPGRIYIRGQEHLFCIGAK